MKQDGQYDILAPRERVWAALNDPSVLAACIDGCQSMEQRSDTGFQATVRAKVGPVSAVFKAEIELSDVRPPEGYTLTASASGGAAGFGRGTAAVNLEPQATADGEESTRLTYTVDAKVGGKLAQIGSRLVDGAARKMADDFFREFSAAVAAGDAASQKASSAATGVDESAGNDAGQVPEYEPSQQWKVWLLVFGILIGTFLLTM